MPENVNKAIRKVGLKADQEGIYRRYLREMEDWDAHHKLCKQFICEEISRQNITGTIAVLGSGWLLDLPMEELISNSKHLYLYDIVHPKQILKKYHRHPKISFIQADLTGGFVEWAYQFKRKFKRKKFVVNYKELENMKFNPEFNLDFIISANVLSQLGSIPIDYLKQHFSSRDINFNKLNQIVQENHCKLINQVASCIYFDVEEEYYDEKMNLTGSKPSVFAENLKAEIQKEWVWNFDSTFSYKEDFITKLKVKALS